MAARKPRSRSRVRIMRDDSLDEMSMIVGALREAVTKLDETVTTWTEKWERQDELATQGRRELYGKVDNLRDEVHGLSTDLRIMRRDVDSMNSEVGSLKSTIEEFKETRAEARGAGKLWQFMSSKITWVCSLIATVIGSLIVYKIKQGGDTP